MPQRGTEHISKPGEGHPSGLAGAMRQDSSCAGPVKRNVLGQQKLWGP